MIVSSPDDATFYFADTLDGPIDRFDFDAERGRLSNRRAFVDLAGTGIGPGYEPERFKPWGEETAYFRWPAKEGPYRIAVVNGFAKAYAAEPDIAKDLAAFKAVSVGTDMAARARSSRSAACRASRRTPSGTKAFAR